MYESLNTKIKKIKIDIWCKIRLQLEANWIPFEFWLCFDFNILFMVKILSKILLSPPRSLPKSNAQKYFVSSLSHYSVNLVSGGLGVWIFFSVQIKIWWLSIVFFVNIIFLLCIDI